MLRELKQASNSKQQGCGGEGEEAEKNSTSNMASRNRTRLPITILDDSNKLNLEGFNEVLNKVGKRPLVIYSINGATRTGKSYALNYFIRYLTWKSQSSNPGEVTSLNWFDSPQSLEEEAEFKWRSGRERETVGIHLWPEPFIIPDQGRDLAVLLMDTQGLFDEKTSMKENGIIFSVSTLCSSLTIFNLMKNLDESILQQFEYFANYAQIATPPTGAVAGSGPAASASASGSGSQGHQNKVMEAFQNLIFLVRDFGFPDYKFGLHDKNTSGGRQGQGPPGHLNYFNALFTPSTNSNENRAVRQKILDSYNKTGIFLLPHPGKNFELQGGASDDDFNAHLKIFVETMLSPPYLAIKKIGGHEVTGMEFQEYLRGWKEVIDEAEIFPDAPRMSQSTAMMQNLILVQNIVTWYQEQIESYLQGQSANQMGQMGQVQEIQMSGILLVHKKVKSDAWVKFDESRKLGDLKLIKKYRRNLGAGIDKKFQEIQTLYGIKSEYESRARGWSKLSIVMISVVIVILSLIFAWAMQKNNEYIASTVERSQALYEKFMQSYREKEEKSEADRQTLFSLMIQNQNQNQNRGPESPTFVTKVGEFVILLWVLSYIFAMLACCFAIFRKR